MQAKLAMLIHFHSYFLWFSVRQKAFEAKVERINLRHFPRRAASSGEEEIEFSISSVSTTTCWLLQL